MDNSTADAPDPRRRRLLTAGVSGAALAALLTRPAAASSSTDPEEATTTTAPPKKPTDADVDLLVFAQAAELAALDLYTAALGSGAFDGDESARASVARIAQHHDAYAEVLGGLLGRASTTTADAGVLSAHRAGFTGGDAASIAQAAHGFERSLLATHTDLLGRLDGIDGAGLVASIAVVEARHVAVLAQLAGLAPATAPEAFFGTNDAPTLPPA